MSSFPFLALPLELRESIYSLYFKPADRLHHSDELNAEGFFGGVYSFEFDLYQVNKQVYREAKAVWKRENVFVRICTPWPSAGMYRVYLMSEEDRNWDEEDRQRGGMVNHIASEGLVPIVCTDVRANSFTDHHALVQITAPFHQAVPEHTVIVLLDDLHLFTQTWYYSALSYPMLNDRLSTLFQLTDPSTPLPLQRRLLLPFEQIKGLYHKEITNYASSVSSELERRMAIPIPTLTQCCESAAEYMDKGDALLNSSNNNNNSPDANAQDALDLYIQAFRAIHILITHRTRRVLADVFFHASIPTGRFAGQTGMTVRVVLRLKLVARVVLAYLKMHQHQEAAFWGQRSIRIMRESMDVEFEDFLAEFIGGEDVGLIYVRTGVALWVMEKEGLGAASVSPSASPTESANAESSEHIWNLAKKFLKGRRKDAIRKELRDFGVPGHVVALFSDEATTATEDGSVSAQFGSEED